MTRQKLTYLILLISTLCFGQTWQWAKSSTGNTGEGFGGATDAGGNVLLPDGFRVAQFFLILILLVQSTLAICQYIS